VSLLSTLDIGRSALASASTGLATTAHNVANASTDGYSRRSIATSIADSVSQGGLLLGAGVRVDSIVRATDALLGVRLVAHAGTEAESRALLESLSIIESSFNEAQSSGISQRLEEVFDSFGLLTSDPSDPSLRATALDSVSRFTAAMSSTYTGVASVADELTLDAEGSLDDINSRLQELAALNVAISNAGGGLGAGDLADKRDQLLQDLAGRVGVTATINADGQATVYLGGHAVVSGDQARQLSLDEDPEGQPRVLLSSDKGFVDVTDEAGGRVGGLLQASKAAHGYLDQLDRLAEAVASAFNSQHAAGFDADGNPGGDIFTYTAGRGSAATLSVDSALLANVDLLALAGSSAAEAGDSDNLALLLEIEAQQLLDGETAQEFASSLINQVGTATAAAEADLAQASSVLADLAEVREAIAGVDLDEEAIKLIQFQAAFEAASKIIRSADKMLGIVMDLV
jgi:flagellar hook-associated protein 1 FlgK